MDIRLVCSDIDGTLLQYGKKELEGEIFEQIRALHQRGHLVLPGLRAAVYQLAQTLCTGGRLLRIYLRKRRHYL